MSSEKFRQFSILWALKYLDLDHGELRAGFKEDWGPESLYGPIESFKVGFVSLNSIFPAIYCDNPKVSVYIRKLRTGGFQAHPTHEYHFKLKVLELSKTEPNFMKKNLWIKLH